MACSSPAGPPPRGPQRLYVVARPVVLAGIIGQELRITLRAAQNLGLREATGWGRYRAWGSSDGWAGNITLWGNLEVQGIRHDFPIQSRLQALPHPGSAEDDIQGHGASGK